MIEFNSTWLKVAIASVLKRNSLSGFHNGRPESEYYQQQCTARHTPTGTIMIYTRDIGMHDCGWWKNPDYNQCFHLSLSFRDFITGKPISRDDKLTKEWIDVFFGDNKNKLWCEAPFSKVGKINDVYHYRLFCDKGWNPILPRKEVYSKDFTPANWKSYSELNEK